MTYCCCLWVTTHVQLALVACQLCIHNRLPNRQCINCYEICYIFTSIVETSLRIHTYLINNFTKNLQQCALSASHDRPWVIWLSVLEIGPISVCNWAQIAGKFSLCHLQQSRNVIIKSNNKYLQSLFSCVFDLDFKYSIILVQSPVCWINIS